MSRERQSLARNMSAPPSTTLTFAALAPEAGARGDPVADGAGLSHVCRLDFGRVLFGREVNMGARKGAAEEQRREDCLRLAYPKARAESQKRTRPSRAMYVRAKAAPIEALADELREIVAAVPLAAAGVPPFGLLLPTQGADRAVEASLCRTLAILARQRGSVFLRDCDPLVWSALDGRALDLWVPVSATGRPA